MRNTSESKRAPFVAGPHLRDDPGEPHGLGAPGHLALAHDDVVELQILLLGEGDPERQRGGVLGPEHPSDRLIAHASDGSARVRHERTMSWSDLPLSGGPSAVGFAAAPTSGLRPPRAHDACYIPST